MKPTRILVAFVATLSLATAAQAAGTITLSPQPPARAAAGAAPAAECGRAEQALGSARSARDAAGKPDLSACAQLKGAKKKECQAPLREQAKTRLLALRQRVSEARKALSCCANPAKKSCARP